MVRCPACEFNKRYICKQCVMKGIMEEIDRSSFFSFNGNQRTAMQAILMRRL
jgi:hypothetical protein